MIDLSQISPDITLKMIVAIIVWIWASLMIMYYRRGTEWIGIGMVILGTILFISHPTSPAPWVLLASGVLFHFAGRFLRSRNANKKTINE